MIKRFAVEYCLEQVVHGVLHSRSNQARSVTCKSCMQTPARLTPKIVPNKLLPPFKAPTSMLATVSYSRLSTRNDTAAMFLAETDLVLVVLTVIDIARIALSIIVTTVVGRRIYGFMVCEGVLYPTK